MSLCLRRLALLTRYDKLPSLLTPSLGYLWLINWTKKGPCRPSRGTLQCSSSRPSSKRRTKEGRGEGRTNVSAPWLETVLTKEFKICFFLKKKKNLWQLRWTSLGRKSCAPHSQPVLLSGTFQRSRSLVLCVWLPSLFSVCLENQHHMVETLRGPKHSPSCFMNLLWDFQEVTELSELQIPSLWSESVRLDDLRVYFSSKRSKKTVVCSSLPIVLV